MRAVEKANGLVRNGMRQNAEGIKENMTPAPNFRIRDQSQKINKRKTL
jgi:hypothetical protein